jgi:hypothetical protein
MYRVVLARSLETFTLVVFAAIAASAVSAQSPRAARDTPANLTGAWTLNRDLSDDAGELMEAMQGGDHGGSGGGRTPGGFGGGHGPGMHGGGGTAGNRGGLTPEQMRARMGDVLEAPARITIVHSNGSVTVTDNHGRSQRLTTNNKKEKRPVDNRRVEVRAKWDDGRLINETWLGDGMKLTETYSLASEWRQLHVAVKLEGSHLPRSVTFRRVYDAESVR